MVLLLTMIFFHIIDDFHLQGILASMKQKDWWKEHAPDAMYRNDWMIAMMIHAFSWAFMIHIPILYCHYINHNEIPVYWFVLLFGLNWAIHAIVDDMKANKRIINLIVDQSIHITQIVVTWLVYIHVMNISVF